MRLTYFFLPYRVAAPARGDSAPKPSPFMTPALINASVVVAYLVVTLAIGIFGSRLIGRRRGSAAPTAGGETAEDYYLGGRNIPAWLAGMSVAVTAMNADVGPFYSGQTAGIGLPVVWFYLSRFAFAYMIAGLLFAYLWRRLGVATAPEFFTLRFGGDPGVGVRVWTSLYAIATGMVPWIGAGLIGVHAIFGPVFGYASKELTLLVTLPVVMLYVWFSGYKGVLVTDFLQGVVIIAANVAVMIFVLMRFGGPSGLADAITTSLGPRDAAQALSLVPVPGQPVLGPLGVWAWFILATIGFGGTMSTEGQRILSARSSREAMKTYVWSGIGLFIMLATLTLPVLGMLALDGSLYTAPTAVREASYGAMLREFLPTGFLGLGLAALAAAVMSTISSHLGYGAQTFMNDVVKPFHPTLSDRAAILWGRVVMLVIMAASVVVYYRANSLMQIAVTLAGMFGATVTFAWGQWWWWRANFRAWMAAMFLGPAIYWGLTPGLELMSWWQAIKATGPSADQLIAVLQGVIALVISTAVWMTVAALTPPEDMEVLKAFYRRARPMGAWGPVRDAIAADDPGALPPEKAMLLPGIGTAALGLVWISSMFVGLSAAYVGKWTSVAVLAAVCVATGLAFKWAFNAYHDRLESTDPQPVEPRASV